MRQDINKEELINKIKKAIELKYNPDSITIDSHCVSFIIKNRKYFSMLNLINQNSINLSFIITYIDNNIHNAEENILTDLKIDLTNKYNVIDTFLKASEVFSFIDKIQYYKNSSLIRNDNGGNYSFQTSYYEKVLFSKHTGNNSSRKIKTQFHIVYSNKTDEIINILDLEIPLTTNKKQKLRLYSSEELNLQDLFDTTLKAQRNSLIYKIKNTLNLNTTNITNKEIEEHLPLLNIFHY